MVTMYQVPPSKEEYTFVDLYSKLPLIDRPMPGLLIYTDGLGSLFCQDGDGSLKKLDLVFAERNEP